MKTETPSFPRPFLFEGAKPRIQPHPLLDLGCVPLAGKVLNGVAIEGLAGDFKYTQQDLIKETNQITAEV